MRPSLLLASLLLSGCATLSTQDDGLRPASAAAGRAAPSSRALRPPTTLALIHASDLESSLVSDPAEDAGGISRFVRLFHALRDDAPHPTLAVVAGDTFMPGPGMKVEVAGENAVDLANRLPRFDVAALGNHEFDLGPAFLAERIRASHHAWLSATVLPVEPVLADRLVPVEGTTPWLEDHPGRLLPRGLHCAGGVLEGEGAARRCTGRVVGVIGATTEALAQISGNATGVELPVDFADLRRQVQAQADALAAEGVLVVVLLSHLQDVRLDLQLVEEGLTGVDVIVSGGGDDRLAATDHRLLAGDEAHPLSRGDALGYPLLRNAADGRPVAIVATEGQMRYVGRLDLAFDEAGAIAAVLPTSRPWPVDERSLQELEAPPVPEAAALEEAVRAVLASEDAPIAFSSVHLDGRREAIRNVETNLGDLAADALAWAARRARPDLPIAFGLRNGGGIRASLGDGPIRRVDIRETFRFDDPVVIVRTSRQILVETLESALRGAGTGRGQFPQLGEGIRLVWEPGGAEQTHRTRDGVVVAIEGAGSRVRQLEIGGEPVVVDGQVIDPDAEIVFATVAFLAAGGDGWFPGATDRIEVLPLELGEQRAFEGYVLALVREGRWGEGAAYRAPAGRLSAVDQ